MSIKKLYKLLEITPKNELLYIEACTHRSYVSENKNDQNKNNERLEFLGDAVLELIITDFLFKKFPEEQEGVLTSFRAAIVNKNNLARIAKNLGLGNFMLLGRGEEMSGGRNKDYLLANLLESLMGALYSDLGFEACEKFIDKHITPSLDEIIEKELFKDPKSKLQEITQEKLGVTPRYEVIHEEGPDHEKVFTMGVFLGDVLSAVGTGDSKRKGEESAAKIAIDKKVWEN